MQLTHKHILHRLFIIESKTLVCKSNDNKYKHFKLNKIVEKFVIMKDI